MRSRAASMAGFTLLPVILAMSLIAAIAFLLNRDNGMNAGMAASQSDTDRARYVAEAGLQAVNAITQGKCGGYTGIGATSFGADSYTATVNPASGTPVTLTATATTAGGASVTLTRSNVAVVGGTASQTLPLQPGAAGGIDAWLDGSSNPKSDNNEGTNPTLYLSGSVKRPLLRFDLSAIPAGSAITVATLSLYQDRTGFVGTVGSAYNVHRITRTWVEGTGWGSKPGDGATWNKYDGVTAWTTPGGQFDPAVAATTPANEIIGLKTWDVTGLVRDWVSGASPNNGMLLDGAGANFSTGFASSDNGTAANRPKLDVTYMGSCGASPPPPPPPPPPVSPVTLPAINDTWIDETGSGAANYGGSTSFIVTNAAKRGRGLVKFDLSSIPVGTVLTSATLRLFTGSFSPKVNSILTVNKAYDPWAEGTRNGSGSADGATWKTRDGTNAWSAGFGIYWGFSAGDPVSTSALSSTFTSGWVEWNITPLAQQWVANPALNYGAGVMIDTSSAVIFNSREFSVYQPQLVITY